MISLIAVLIACVAVAISIHAAKTAGNSHHYVREQFEALINEMWTNGVKDERE